MKVAEAILDALGITYTQPILNPVPSHPDPAQCSSAGLLFTLNHISCGEAVARYSAYVAGNEPTAPGHCGGIDDVYSCDNVPYYGVWGCRGSATNGACGRFRWRPVRTG